MAVVILDDLNEVEDAFELMTYLARALESGDVERLLEEGTITLTKGPGPSANQVADSSAWTSRTRSARPLPHAGTAGRTLGMLGLLVRRTPRSDRRRESAGG